MMLLWIPIVALVVFVLFRIAGPDSRGGWAESSSSPSAPPIPAGPAEGAVGIARERLARGEINSAEFEEIRRVLET